MRLWHTDLIPVLPRQQLLGQWRELNSIFKLKNRHILINFVYDYPIEHLMEYSRRIIKEFERRDYRINKLNYYRYFAFIYYDNDIDKSFPEKMTDRYLRQCYYNLQEKHDCGGITDEEWKKIEEVCKDRV